MERVKKGETYWSLAFAPCGIVVDRIIDTDDIYDRQTFNSGNYFHTREEAETMANKFRAVLKGADVIEMPSEEEVKDKAICIAKNICGDDYWRDCEEAVIRTTDWLKSKIVK